MQHQPSAAAPLEIRALQRGEPVAASSLSAAQVHSIHQQHKPGAATDASTEKAFDVLCLIYMNIVCLVFYLETILSFENNINNITLDFGIASHYIEKKHYIKVSMKKSIDLNNLNNSKIRDIY